MKNIIKLVLIYIHVFFSFTLVYIYLFHTSVFNNEEILFYRGIKITMLVSFLYLFIILILYKSLKKNLETYISALVMSVSINLCIFIVAPVTVDRSVTVFILKSLARNINSVGCKSGVSIADLQNELINTYIIKQAALSRRIKEQTKIQNIDVKNNMCVEIKNNGRNTINLFKIITYIYNLPLK